MRKYLVVATEDELALPLASCLDGFRVIVTGVGGTNVIRALKDIPRDAQIVNIGWAGSTYYSVGSVLRIGRTSLWHPTVDFAEETFVLGNDETLCLTAGDFIEGADLPDHSVVDMELAYIAAFGFSRLSSIKYISDNLNLKEYEQCTKK